jgi:hypothetical protein
MPMRTSRRRTKKKNAALRIVERRTSVACALSRRACRFPVLMVCVDACVSQAQTGRGFVPATAPSQLAPKARMLDAPAQRAATRRRSAGSASSSRPLGSPSRAAGDEQRPSSDVAGLESALQRAVAKALLRSPESAFGATHDAAHDESLRAMFDALSLRGAAVPLATLARVLTFACGRFRCDEADVRALLGPRAPLTALTFDQFRVHGGALRDSALAAADFAARTDADNCNWLQQKILEAVSVVRAAERRSSSAAAASAADAGEAPRATHVDTSHVLEWYESAFLRATKREELMVRPAAETETVLFRQAPTFRTKTMGVCDDGSVNRPAPTRRRLPRSFGRSIMPTGLRNVPRALSAYGIPRFDYLAPADPTRDDVDTALVRRIRDALF